MIINLELLVQSRAKGLTASYNRVLSPNFSSISRLSNQFRQSSTNLAKSSGNVAHPRFPDGEDASRDARKKENGHANVYERQKFGRVQRHLKILQITIYWTPFCIFFLLSIVIIKQSVHIKYTKSTQRQKRLVFSKKLPIKFHFLLFCLLLLLLFFFSFLFIYFILLHSLLRLFHDKVSLIWH